jgi:hypothetical protein
LIPKHFETDDLFLLLLLVYLLFTQVKEFSCISHCPRLEDLAYFSKKKKNKKNKKKNSVAEIMWDVC